MTVTDRFFCRAVHFIGVIPAVVADSVTPGAGADTVTVVTVRLVTVVTVTVATVRLVTVVTVTVVADSVTPVAGADAVAVTALELVPATHTYVTN